MNWLVITSPIVFIGASAALVAYILYMIIRRRHGERPGTRDTEPEI